MRKIFILTIIAMFTIIGKTYAQNHLVATLDHEGTVSVFTGKDAFINAHEAAIDGDVITLSSGEFNATEITKAISLYGAGMLPYNNATFLSDTLRIDISDVTHELSVEGIRFEVVYTYDLGKATFRKCKFEDFRHNEELRENQESIDFFHCRFYKYLINYKGLINLANCYVDWLWNYDTSMFVCNNSYLGCWYDNQYSRNAEVYNSTFTNCILSSYRPFHESNSIFSCLSMSPEDRYVYITIEKSSIMFKTDSKVFKDNSYATMDDYTFELTDEAKTTYLGNDGTEVGIYGGAMPYNPTPSVPRIKSFRMDAKPSEGILKADVEVE